MRMRMPNLALALKQESVRGDGYWVFSQAEFDLIWWTFQSCCILAISAIYGPGVRWIDICKPTIVPCLSCISTTRPIDLVELCSLLELCSALHQDLPPIYSSI
jgi:hypothetical protein